MSVTDIIEMLINILLELFRWLIPLLALAIILKCLRSLFRTRTTVSTMAVLVNPITHDELALVNWENSIGRSKQCDIVLNYPTVSRSHAVVFKTKEGWKVTDTGSKTGVFINGKKIKKALCLTAATP